MKIELTPENAAALAKYAALAGQTPTEFLNRYLSENMLARCSRTPDQATLKVTWGNLEYCTRVDA